MEGQIVPSRKTNPEFMTGVPELLILRLLCKHEMYGYELVQAIQTSTGSAITLGEGVVYPILHALKERGCLRSKRKPVNGRTRVYYAATRKGAVRLKEMTIEWQRVSSVVANVLEGKSRAAAGA